MRELGVPAVVVGADYEGVTRAAALRGDPDAAAVLVAFREVRSGATHREVRYACPTDSATRVLRLQVLPASAGADRLLLVHLPDDGFVDPAVSEELQGGLMHDLLTPLQVAFGWSELLAGARERLDEQLTEEAQRAVHRHLEYAVALVTSRTTARGLEAIELSGAVAAVAQDFEELQLEQLGTEGVLVRATELALERVLRNLLGNARKYGAAPVRVAAERTRHRVRVRVSDGGSGVPQDVAVGLFTSGVRSSSHEAMDGSGLGLAIVQRSMRDVGGTVTIDLEAPTTTFVLDFAVADPGPADDAGPGVGRDPARRQGSHGGR